MGAELNVEGSISIINSVTHEWSITMSLKSKRKMINMPPQLLSRYIGKSTKNHHYYSHPVYEPLRNKNYKKIYKIKYVR